MAILSLNQSSCALFIVAHDDDAAMLGTSILSLIENSGGRSVILAMNTSDVTGGSIEEFRSAYANFSSVETIALNRAFTQDMSIKIEKEIIMLLMKTIADIKPTLIVTHNSKDIHRDHRNTTEMTYQALYHGYNWGGLSGPLLCLEGEVFTPHSHATLAIPVEFQVKENLLRKFVSQMEMFNWIELVRAQNRARAIEYFSSKTHAEAFHIYKVFGDLWY
jgi:LmbE family N-acetylglucosaminyl deacetylase